MNTCMCGNPIDTIGTRCSRCGALQTLGLEMNATAAQIEEAYKTLIKVWHPDRFQSDPKMLRAAEEKLKEVNGAHDYLTAGPAFAPPSPPPPQPNTMPHQDARPGPAFVRNRPTDDEQPEELRRVMKRLNKRSRGKTLLRVFVALAGFSAVVLLAMSLDFLLSENAGTSRSWGEVKAQLSRDIHANGVRIWSLAAGNLHNAKDENTQTLQPASQTTTPTPVIARAESSSRHPSKVSKPISGAKPYVTSGLTPVEVISILGNPTSSSGEKMFYKASEIDFRNGQVVGWKVDSGSAPIRVKLWPQAPLVPGVTTFGPGSSKSDVIALQGTPTLFSDNEFGYGGSMVFFKNDRVVGWKENPASTRLRVVAH